MEGASEKSDMNIFLLDRLRDLKFPTNFIERIDSCLCFESRVGYLYNIGLDVRYERIGNIT